ncbi:helix-turn-helix transcriptional regulator [Streptomyces sp. AC536]|uniref:helix-turn-helix domain-containing protein n=1 Tax=Streptomyces buecherae TaxID=2763006 RepID=UPI00164EB6F6|nr:helix-turn-helix transcriptional regulator [Streptomyces buecherae]MBC3985976.1 helix-turn-helix transcriptional regulator [Streptomyces buecherae]QNJ40519.1 helix-turn-helix transcriptional regulator [Streptomyces buecherae]
MKLQVMPSEGDRATARTLPGRHLKRLREQSGLSLRALAEKLHYPHSYISRVEHHEQLPSEALANALDESFSTGGLFVDLLTIAQDSMVTRQSRDCFPLEARSIRIQVISSNLVPGLLQTEEYARGAFSLGLARADLPALEEIVAFRLRRQELFTREDPPQYWAIMDESALRRLTADPRLMVIQLEHLLHVAAEPHINIQVMPLSEPFHPVMGGSLTLLTLENGTTTALLESFASGEVISAPRQVVDHLHRFNVACAQALTPADSLDLIRRYLREYG